MVFVAGDELATTVHGGGLSGTCERERERSAEDACRIPNGDQQGEVHVIEYSAQRFIGRDTRRILNTANTTRRRSRCSVTSTEREAVG
jgi:hypothetical protein